MSDTETLVHGAHHIRVANTAKTVVLNYSSGDGKRGELFQLDKLTDEALNNLVVAVAIERIRRTHDAEAAITVHIKMDGL